MKALLRSSPPQAFQCTVWPLALSRISAHGLVSAARQGSARATNPAATAADSLIVNSFFERRHYSRGCGEPPSPGPVTTARESARDRDPQGDRRAASGL